LEIAKHYCQEVEFLLHGKEDTGVGFRNRAGGYELRSENFKGGSSPKAEAVVGDGGNELVVFEGFFDFLSYHSIPNKQQTTSSDSLILNSLSFLERSRPFMEKYQSVCLMLDQDKAGKEATQKILRWDKARYFDKSQFYQGKKDLNDWLVAQNVSIKRRDSIRRTLCVLRVASYVLVAPKPLKTSSLPGIWFVRFSHSPVGGFKNNSAEGMELKERTTRKKGGRPRKAVRKEHVLALKCSLFEKKAIAIKAKSTNLSVSGYLRQMALSGKVDMRVRVLPKEVLIFTARLNHIAANLNQIGRKRNGGDELEEPDRANLQAQSRELKELTDLIKSSLR